MSAQRTNTSLTLAKRLVLAGAMAVTAMVSVPAAAQSQNQTANIAPAISFEYRLKAAFLYNFTKFAEWPAQSFSTAGAPLELCIAGDNPFRGALAAATAGKRIHARPLKIKPVAGIKNLDGCHVLFVGPMTKRQMARLILATRKRPILTVSESAEFARAGGIIHLKTVNKKVRFVINLDSAKRAGVKFSSKLLRLAEIVQTLQGKTALITMRQFAMLVNFHPEFSSTPGNEITH